jgi:hypothetical protein
LTTTCSGIEPGSASTSASEEAKRANAFGRLADFARVEGVAFDRAELAADHLIQRGGVAFDVDAFDKHPVAARRWRIRCPRLVASSRVMRGSTRTKFRPFFRARFPSGRCCFDQRGE